MSYERSIVQLQERSANHRERIVALETDMKTVNTIIAEGKGAIRQTILLSSVCSGAIVGFLSTVFHHFIK